MNTFHAHSAPFLGGPIPEGAPFATSQDDRVHLLRISFHDEDAQKTCELVLKNSFLLAFTHAGADRKTLRWDDWGRRNTRFFDRGFLFEWLRFVPISPATCVFELR